MTLRVAFSLAVTLALAMALATTAAAGPAGPANEQVKVSMHARWAPSSVAQEAAEFFKSKGPDALVGFLAGLGSQDLLSLSDADAVSALLTSSSAADDPAAAALLRYALNVGLFSPAVEAGRQVARTHLSLLGAEPACAADGAGVAVVAGESVWCGAAAVEDAVASGALATAASAAPLAGVIQDAVAAGVLAVVGSGPPAVVLYGTVGAPATGLTWARVLSTVVDGVVFCHGPAESAASHQPLSGFAVDLAIKSTEYKVVDDDGPDSDDDDGPEADTRADANAESLPSVGGIDFAVLADRVPDAADALTGVATAVAAGAGAVPEVKPLKKWQVASLGSRAAAMVAGSSDPLATLAHVANNLPGLTNRIAKHGRPSASLKATMRAAAQSLGMGTSALSVNGLALDLDKLDAFTLFDLVQQELGTLSALTELGVSPSAAAELASASSPAGASDAIRVAVDKPQFVSYLNNLARDDRYASWPRSLRQLTQPSYGFPRIRLNVVTAIYVCDPSNPQSLSTIHQLFQFHGADVPLRFGLVFADSNAPEPQDMTTAPSLASKIIRVFEFVRSETNSATAWRFLANMGAQARGGYPSEAHIQAALQALDGWTGPVTAGEIIDGIDMIDLVEDYYARVEYANALGVPPHAFVLNSFVIPVTMHLQGLLGSAVRSEFARLGSLVARGTLTDKTNVFAFVNSEPGVLASYSQLMVPSSAHPLLVVQTPLSVWEGHTWVAGASASEPALSVLVVGDGVEDAVQCVTGVLDAFLTQSPDAQLRYAVTGADRAAGPWDAVGVAEDVHLVVNGRVIVVDPTSACTSLSTSDFATLIDIEMAGRVAPLRAVSTTELAPGAFAAASSTVFASARAEASSGQSPVPETLTPIPVTRTSAAASSGLVVRAVVNPLSEEAQTLAPLLEVLAVSFGADVSLGLNPNTKLSSVPLDRFVRTALAPGLAFDASTGARVAPVASFAGLPTQFLLTLGVSTPSAWLVEPVDAVYDLDNLQLSELKRGTSVAAVYELSDLLLEGRSYTARPIKPPTGLELVLCTPGSDTPVQDTVVMANLGYFQLKASPGIWHLGLKASRPSSELYSMLNASSFDVLRGAGPHGVDQATIDTLRMDKGAPKVIPVTSFAGASSTLLVAKRDGYEDVELLDVHAQGSSGTGALSSMWSSLVGGGKGGGDEVINVFSVASGHLYERFLKIMVKSVISHTDKPVKFWFIRNFLSPSFKKFLPVYAAAEGFDFELVTYQWPAWLNGQTEKQRLIWGYKILFLDVLFPLDVNRVIFVDADQIVRADMSELVNMDLGGAPYGFTPFCDSNPDTEGFRFWKQGYWNSHLKGRPYHISALFVIDLNRFRALSAGDSLRATYQSLSQDPNSLSNLDQDLPNYLQHQVPIFSLPQEWLWCQTWCSAESKPSAKTIDLCNNPLTKIPKLEAAKTIVPEWTSYDDYIKALERGQPAHAHDEL